MEVYRTSVYRVDLPLKESCSLSGGRLVVERLDSTFVRIDTDSGVPAGCPWSHTYLPAHGPGLRAAIGTLAPSILGRDPRSLDTVNRSMDIELPGHLYAKSPFDMACRGIVGKAAGMALWQLMGGDEAAPVEVNSSIPTGSPDSMVTATERARIAGVPHPLGQARRDRCQG